MLPERAVLLHVSSVNIFLRTYLLIHRHAQQWGETEIDSTEITGVDSVEISFCLIVIKAFVLLRIHIEIERLHVF